MPDGLGAVVGAEEGSVVSLGYANRAAPYGAVRQHESSQEVFVFAGGVAIMHGQTNNFITGALGSVPGAVLGGESVAFELGWELGPFVEKHFERSEVGIDQNVRSDDLGLQFGVFAGVAWVVQATKHPELQSKVITPDILV